MDSQVLENQLNLALDVPESTREKTLDLNVGFDPLDQSWELIVKYSGDISAIAEELAIGAVELSSGYAILTVPESLVDRLSTYPQIEFIEKPKRLFYEANEGRRASCINPVQTPNINLFGEGVLVAIIDSGIDYAHPDFRKEDGSTRIVALWDQSIAGNPPEGFRVGSLYTTEQINLALETPMPQRLEIVPSTDLSGHGTHVAGIAAGNGRASNGLYRGVASRSDLIIVKLGRSIGDSFPRTTQLMEAIEFVIRESRNRNQPIAINISFGNSYGSHTGFSILENYINDVSQIGKTSIIIGTGNEGASNNHAQGILSMGNVESVDLAVGEFEFSLNVQIWKNYYDHFDVSIVSPGGVRVGPIPSILGTQQFRVGDTEIVLFYGEPKPYSPQQEVYLEFIPVNTYVTAGVWRIELTPRKIVVGNYDLWLPAGGVLNPSTRFLLSSEYTTLTIPSTAQRAISVGAYNSFTGAYAPFSGRGFTRDNRIKPDLVAPGVNITSCAPNGGYSTRSGTSMATPFVTGSAALLMEWGIVKNNDPYLYGEKMRVILIDGARPLRIEAVYPNRTLGYGALCLQESYNNLVGL